jgi:hypothetical protein
MPDIIITPSSGKLEFIDNSTQTIRRHAFTLDHNDGIKLDAPLSAAAVIAPLNVINVTVNNSNVNYPFVLASGSAETGTKTLMMDGSGGTYNPFTNTATIDISGNSATTTLASNSTNLGGVAAASYVTLTGTQTLTNKTITGTFTGNLTGTGSWATNAVNANTATNSTQLNGQSDSYYTNIPARLGYTPVNKAGDTVSGNLTVNGNFSVNGSFTAFSASNIYITSSNLTVTDNILLMNALSPYQRYAGLQMYDSGSNTLSQFLWDGEGDYFFLTGSSVNGKIITGPDGQTNLSSNYIPKATAGYKLGNSLLYDNGTNVGIGTTSPATKLDVVGDVTMPAIKQSATLYNGTDISDDNSTRTVYFNIPAGGYSPITYFKVARIKITGNYQNVSLNGYFTAANSALHVGFERKVEFDFIAYAATNAGAPQVTYIKRGQDTTTVLVYAVANGGGAGTTYYDVYIKHGWYNDTHGELAIRVGYSSAVTVWQSGLDSGTSAPVDTLVNPNSNYNFDTTGFVGIGTTTPSRKLHVYSSGLSDNTVNPLLLIDGKFTAAGVDSNDIVGIAFRVENSAGGSQTTTCIGSSYQGAGNALLLQPVSGNVGVGTINPSFKLDIGAAGNDVVSVRLTPGYERVRYYGFDLLGYNDGNLWMIGNNPTNTLVLGKTWDWDNQIGIAYTPGTVGNSGGILQIGQISKNNANYTHGITRLYTNGLERITIIANGNVGISTTLPTTPLHVVGVISGSSFSGAGTGLTGTASGLSIGGSAATWTTARTLTIGSTGKSVNGSADVSWSLTELGVGNGTITIAAGTGVGVGSTNTFTTNQSGATTVTITNTGVTSLTTNTGLSSNVSATGAVTITNTGVTSNVAGTGISVSGATGAVTITNSGVTSAVAGTGVGVSGATGAVTFSIGQAVGTGNSPTFAAVTTSTDGANHIMAGTTNAEGIRMTPASSTTYPVFLRSINPGVGEASPWIYKEQATDWGIWHNNPVNSIDFTKQGSVGISTNVGGSSTNAVTVRVEMATGFVQTIAGYRNSAGTTILDNNGNITGTAAGETLSTVTGRGNGTGTQIIVATAAGQAMYIGRQAGAGYSYGSAGIFTALSDNPNGGSNIFYQGYISSSASTPGGILTYSVRADGQIYTTMNTATGIANNSFSVAKTVLGTIHIANGSGTSGNNRQAAITFQGDSATEAQAGIYVSNNNSSGTAMGFATTDNYGTGPQLFMTATNAGVVNFSRARPTYAGNALVDVAGGQTIAGITYFSNGESMNVYGIRGRFTNEYLHLYNKVGVGHPGGWGQGEGNTPSQGLSTYGGISIAYGTNATSIFYGNVGVGTTSVSARVESYYSSNAITFNYLATNLNNNSPIPVYGFDVTNGSGETRSIKAGIGYERHLTNGRGTIHFYNDSTNDTQSLSGNRTSAGDIKMSIDNDGNVGIGTPTPTYKLQVQGSFYVNSTAYINGALTVDDNIIVTAGNDFGIYDSDGTGAYWQYMDSGIAYLRIDDGGSANGKLNINSGLLYVGASGGNVGISSTTPGYKLDVVGDINFSSTLKFGGINVVSNAGGDVYLNGRVIRNESNTSQDGMYIGYNSTGTTNAHIRFFANATNERMRIQANDGNVGIGTTTAGQKLDVEGRIRTRGASGTGGFEIGAASSGAAKWRIEWDSASDSLDFNWVG